MDTDDFSLQLSNLCDNHMNVVVKKFIETLKPVSVSKSVMDRWELFLIENRNKSTNQSIENDEKNTSAIETLVSNPTRCAYVFKKGKNLDKICGVVVKEGGGNFCGKHKTIPQISTKAFEVDLANIQVESEEEIYLSAVEEVSDIDEIEQEEVEDEIVGSEVEDDVANDDGGGDDVVDEDFEDDDE